MFSLEYLSTLVVLAFVIGLILLLFYGVKRLGLAGPVVTQIGERRLGIVEVLPLDARRKLVLLRRDDTEHLVILGVEGERIVETGIDASNRPRPQSRIATFSESVAKLTGGRLTPGQPSGPTQTDKSTGPDDK